MIVSGLAHGCDAFANEGCLEEAGATAVAVLAHGLDKVYPAATRGLAERLLARGPAWPANTPSEPRPVRAAYAERDQLQSGLYVAVLVIETALRWGTMHTVRFAIRDVRSLASTIRSGCSPKTR